MKWLKALFLTSVFLVLNQCVSAQKGRSLQFPSSRSGLYASCELESGEAGTCRAISECPAVLSDLHSVSPKHCGWRGKEPLVCCPGPKLGTENTCATSLKPTKRQVGLASTFFKKPLNNETSNDKNVFINGSNPLIVGGVVSPNNSRPWMVAIAWKVDNVEVTASDKLACGGTLIGTHHILTAAHCFVSSSNPNDFEVYFGTNNLSMTDNGISIISILKHPNFDSSRLYYDIAIVRLKEEVSFSQRVRPACLPMGSLRGKKFEHNEGLVTGWGLTQYLGAKSLELREVELNILSNAECNETISKIPQLMKAYPQGATSNVMCAGVEEGRKDACQGDSGGPLVWTDHSSKHFKWILLGIVSGGYRCGEPGIPGIYTRVTTYLDWIVRNAT